jgi:hypothetical protein
MSGKGLFYKFEIILIILLLLTYFADNKSINNAHIVTAIIIIGGIINGWLYKIHEKIGEK